MWGHRIKIRKADKMFSDYIRSKANWKCQNCGKDCNDNHALLEASHFHGRRKESVRFDARNVFAICKGCHWKFHEDKQAHKAFVERMIGFKEMEELWVAARTPKQKDDVMTILMIKEMMKELHPQYKPEDK